MWKTNKIIGHEKPNTYRSPEYKQFLKLRLLSFAIIGLISAGVLFGCFFIYKNIFLTVSQAEEIILVKSNLTVLEIIDFDKFDRVKKLWQEKSSPAMDLPEIDPFNYHSPTSTSSTLP